MRQKIRILGLSLLFVALASGCFAEIILGGCILEKTSKFLQSRSAGDKKEVILAHIFNADSVPLKKGIYEIGLEFQGLSGNKVYKLKPQVDINPGQLKTVRMSLPITKIERSGTFRVFSVMSGKKTFSDSYSLANRKIDDKAGDMTMLYTEAPPEPGKSIPPKEVPFEDDGFSPPAKKTRIRQSATTVTAKPLAPKITPAAPVNISEKPRSINLAEFKKLRTIDEELVIYVIQKGDSLKSVAERYYGDPQKEKTVAELNFIDNPSSIRAGEEIIVDVHPLGNAKPPSVSSDKSKKSSKKTVKAPVILGKTPLVEKATVQLADSNQRTGEASSYVIQPGDTLAVISKRFFGKRSLAAKITKANPGINPRNLKVGTKILIPAFVADKA